MDEEIDKIETEETGMNKFERRGYEGTMENKWLDKTKLPQIKENIEAKIRGYENLLKDLKNDKSKKSPIERESHEVNLAIAQDNLDEMKGKLKAINEIMASDNSKTNQKGKAAENKKEIDRLMKNGFDRRGAYAKVALDEISERLDTEKDKGVREKLFEDMRDVQQNGLNAKYFETHKEDYGF